MKINNNNDINYTDLKLITLCLQIKRNQSISIKNLN